MSRVGFQKSVRMFHKFSEETMRRRGGDQAGRDSIAALAALEAVLKAERPLTGDLLEPLAAFTNLLQSSQLPPDFGDYSFGDALLAIEEAQAELRHDDPQIWEFEGELSEANAASVGDFAPKPLAADAAEHAAQLRRFVLDAAQATSPKSVLVVGALAEPALPLAELCERCERLTLNDLDLPRLEELVRRRVPEPHRDRVRLERYDATGSYAAFAAGVKRIVAAEPSQTEAEAEAALVAWLGTYDVGAGSAGLSSQEEKPDLAISALLLPELGRGYAPCIATAMSARGWQAEPEVSVELGTALTLLRCLVVQHHIQALLRRAKSAALISAVSEVSLRRAAGGKPVAEGEPRDLLLVERLVERLPGTAEVKAEQSWEWRRDAGPGGDSRSVLTLVEALLV
jgi:hypothetical protein